MENENIQVTENTNNQPKGWADVTISPDMPLSAIVQFLNILNQRLCAVEDITTVDIEGVKKSLTQIYREQTEAEIAEAQKQAEAEAQPSENTEEVVA